MTHARQRNRGKELVPIYVPKHRYIQDGYVLILDPEHPNAQKNGRVMEHVKVMSGLLGRPLFPHENVHHINGTRDDNAPSNLELWSTSQPKGQRVVDKIEWCVKFLGDEAPHLLEAAAA